MLANPAKSNQPVNPTGTVQATCWCGEVIEATTMQCLCGGGITVLEHPGCGTTISGAHTQGCTYIADNIDVCVSCGRDTENCGGSNIFNSSKRENNCEHDQWRRE